MTLAARSGQSAKTRPCDVHFLTPGEMLVRCQRLAGPKTKFELEVSPHRASYVLRVTLRAKSTFVSRVRFPDRVTAVEAASSLQSEIRKYHPYVTRKRYAAQNLNRGRS